MDSRLDDTGKLILRVGVAGLLLMHGIAKLQNGIGFIENQVEQVGMPAIVAYGVFVGEVIAPLLVMAGLFTRPAALIMAFNLFMAIMLARRDDIGTVGPGGGLAIEVETLFIIASITIACLGPGRFSVGKPGRISGYRAPAVQP